MVEPREEDVRFLIVHHSASNDRHRGTEVPTILRGFYDFHTGPTRGWADIAYNFVVDADGGIWEGRAGSMDGPVAGDATGGNQGFAQLVCLIGDFDSAHPSAAALASLVEVLAWLAVRYDVSTSPGAEVSFVSRGSNLHPAGAEVTTPTITGHRTMSQTSCPGAQLNDYVVTGLSADVHARRVQAVGSSTTSGAPSTTTTTAIQSTTTAPTTSIPPAPTSTAGLLGSPPTTLPLASSTGDRLVPGWVGGVGAVVATLGGFVVWRHRRLREATDATSDG